MARYIDADALIERLGINQDCTECSYCTRTYFCSWNPDPGEICIAISEQPTVTINDLTEEIKVTNCNYNQFADVSKKGDTISRKAVYDALECMRFASDAERRYGFSLLEQIPTAQPEIIRCKDCKHYYFADNRVEVEQCYVCGYWDFDSPSPNGFCSFAERRTDEA